MVVAQWQSTGGYNQTAWVRFPATASVFFFEIKAYEVGGGCYMWCSSSVQLISTQITILCIDDTCGALVQFDCYHHSIQGIRPNPVITL